MAVYTWETEAVYCEFAITLVYMEKLGLKEKQEEQEKERADEKEEEDFRSIIRKF